MEAALAYGNATHAARPDVALQVVSPSADR
jgi:hypothetical protein